MREVKGTWDFIPLNGGDGGLLSVAQERPRSLGLSSEALHAELEELLTLVRNQGSRDPTSEAK